MRTVTYVQWLAEPLTTTANQVADHAISSQPMPTTRVMRPRNAGLLERLVAGSLSSGTSSAGVFIAARSSLVTGRCAHACNHPVLSAAVQSIEAMRLCVLGMCFGPRRTPTNSGRSLIASLHANCRPALSADRRRPSATFTASTTCRGMIRACLNQLQAAKRAGTAGWPCCFAVHKGCRTLGNTYIHEHMPAVCHRGVPD